MAHTIKVIAGGLVLLALCLLIGRWADGTKGLAIAAVTFIPLWLGAAAINMWVGVKKAGYSVADELPIFFVVFAVPVAGAVLVLWLIPNLFLLLFWAHD